MKNKIFEINVDFETKSAVDTDLIKIVKGDYNSIEFDLKMDKTDYKRAVLFLVKPSKKNFVVDIANSKAIFTEKNTFDEIGIYYYGIVLYGTNSKLTTSTKGKIQVVEGYNEDNEDITGDDNYPILDTLIKEVTDLKDKINASLGVMNKTFKEVTYDASTGVMSFKNLNNEVTNINLPLSLLISSASYDNDNKKIVLTLANNDTIDIPILDLVSNYYDDKINANKEYIASTSNELYRLKTDVLETGESSGNNIHLEDSALSEVQEISVEMDKDRVQKTTTGKNLFDYVSNLKTSTDGLTSVINDDGSITTTGKPSTDYRVLINPIDITDILEDGQIYTISQSNLSNKLYIQVSAKKADGTSTYYYLLNKLSQQINVDKSVYVSYNLIISTGLLKNWGDTSSTITNKYMLCKGTDTADTSFEPYTGGQPSPSPDFPQNISVLTGNLKVTSCGKNLVNPVAPTFTRNGVTFKKNEDGTYTLNGTSTTSFDNNIINLDNKIKVNKNRFYRLSLKVFSGTCTGGNLATNVNLVLNNDSIWAWLKSNDIAKQPTDNGYIQFINLYVANNTTFSDYRVGIQLEVVDNGTSLSTEWEPYQGSSLNITIPENEFVGKLDDTYKDTLKVEYNEEDGHYHLILNKMVGKRILNSSDMSTRIVLNTGDIMYRTMKYTDILNKEFIILCNRYIGIENAVNRKDGNIYWNSINRTIDIIDNRANITTIDEFKTWLSTHNTEVCYPLETPYEIDLGIVDQLLTFDEITNIFTDSDLYPVINVKYYRNFIKTIRNLQVNNDTLKNELSNIESRLTTLENANTSVVDNNPTEESEVTE